MYCAMRDRRAHLGDARSAARTEAYPCGFDEGKFPVVRSTFMKAEEIDREREQSGWNPYVGEEEAAVSYGISKEEGAAEPDRISEEERTPKMSGILGKETMEIDEIPNEELQEAERELRKLQAMYPDTAKLLLPFVEEECDKMEYEGSPMFDEYPDRSTVYRIEGHIFEQVKDQFPAEEIQEPEEVLAMQLPGPRVGMPGRSWARDLARVLLLNEMHHRRCRHRGLRRV